MEVAATQGNERICKAKRWPEEGASEKELSTRKIHFDDGTLGTGLTLLHSLIVHSSSLDSPHLPTAPHLISFRFLSPGAYQPAAR